MDERVEVSDEVVRSLPDFQAAIRTCILYSGKQLKEVAFELGIDMSQLSRMVNPSDDPRHFPPNKLNHLMDSCGNEIPLRWMNLRRGYPTPRQVDDLQREIALLKIDLERAGLERRHVVNIFKAMEVR